MNSDPPKLRDDLEFTPTTYEGRQAVIVRDVLGLIGDPIVIQGEALNLVGLIDGRHSIRDIQLEIIRQKGGVFISREGLERLLSKLDDAFVLDGKRYRAAKEKLRAEYAKLDIRNAAHAGQSYPAAKEKLETYLDRILDLKESGPGAEKRRVRAIVAPHIDPDTGEKTYAKAYGALAGAAPRLIVLLGTGHSLEGGFFSLTEKDFKTPLGLARTDKAAVRKLKEAGAGVIAPDDLAHRREHALEFQLIFLQRLFGSTFSIVPILCGSFQDELAKAARASQVPGVGAFLGALTGLLAERGEGALAVAGVDFSHIGPKFGHRRTAAALLPEAKRHDQTLLEACLAQDANAFWAEARRVKDAYNVCGFSTLASLLEILPPGEGRLLDYDVRMEEPTRSAVSFAAMAFY